jgi:hypothetical protein
MILYFSKKWRTISEIVPPVTATFTLASTRPWTNFSAKSYSPLV